MWHEVIILTARWLPFLYWTFWNYILNFFGVLYWLFFLCISTFCFLYYTLFGFYIILFSVFILNLFFIYSFLFYIMIFWKSLLYWKSGGFGLPYHLNFGLKNNFSNGNYLRGVSFYLPWRHGVKKSDPTSRNKNMLTFGFSNSMTKKVSKN
jgi:hypothetical protein